MNTIIEQLKQQDTIGQMDTPTLKAILNSNDHTYQYVDVRSVEEYRQHKLEGFVNMPLQAIGQLYESLNPEIPVILICASGARSLVAAKFLKRQGFKALYNVSGGMMFM